MNIFYINELSLFTIQGSVPTGRHLEGVYIIKKYIASYKHNIGVYHVVSHPYSEIIIRSLICVFIVIHVYVLVSHDRCA